MKKLKRTGATLYWVGLPVLRSKKMSRDFTTFNEIYQQQAREHGVEFIKASHRFRDSRGHFSAFGKTLKGKKRRLRRKDGMHFTREGNDIMAQLIRSHICSG